MTSFEILAVATYIIVLIIAFIVAGVRSRRLKEENSKIYQDEHMNRLESFYKFNVETEEEALIDWAEDEEFKGDGTSYIKSTFNPSEESEITMKDLNDLDEIGYGHMIF